MKKKYALLLVWDKIIPAVQMERAVEGDPITSSLGRIKKTDVCAIFAKFGTKNGAAYPKLSTFPAIFY